MPVSYTHLDVYKRQAYDTPPLAFVHSYGCQQNVNDGERIKGVLVDIGYGPVSYTHLDVYKRQVRHHPGCGVYL